MNNKKGPQLFKGLALYAVIFLVVIAIVSSVSGGFFADDQSTTELEYSDFVLYLEKGMVNEVIVKENSLTYKGKLVDGTAFVVSVPSSYDAAVITEKYLVPLSADGVLTVTTVKASALSGLLGWLPTILMFILLIIMFRSLSGGGKGGVMNFGKSKARMTKGENKITFEKVAALEEEKQELAEIVDYLKNPKKYKEMGARIPRGVLLVGPPGTGKTYISKAVAGEADVPFFSISGSDFVEMFVGVGASRVRDLFADAKKNSPCIVFIDEIDAVGRRRGAGIGGGNDEREQTLNQLLVEMDGFDENSGIIVLAATNRPDVLDPAILRPGRFDRQIVISTPDVKGREEVFALYAKGKPLDEQIDMKVLAKRTPGFTPADIENTMNEAALLTARRNGTIIHMDDIEEAITRVIAGPQKKSRVISEKEKRLTAYHEAGHAVVMRSTEGGDPVHQVTIMPRGSAGGFTEQLPQEDRYYATKTQMEEEIRHLLGGRVAEAIYLKDISTGASNDLERATKIAHDMVTKYGMSEAIGPVNYSDADEVFLGRDFTSKQNYSEELASKIDAEVKSIIEAAYAETEKILKKHKKEIERVAEALLEMETLDQEEFEAVFAGTKTIEELKSADAERFAARKVIEDEEAKKRAEKEAEEAKAAEKEKLNGVRVAILDKDGKFVVKENEDSAEDNQAENSEESSEDNSENE
ncbi:MAG: ATP-dependent zinc metalloprotease FtsH [Clostridia bacterium]|nr:ATP-dependent zinc metalloprotease FtsH [Clostridia bacterium]